MNLETTQNKPSPIKASTDMDLEEFDFKPITQGLGFHHPKVSEVKPAFVEPVVRKVEPRIPPVAAPQVYQNELSLFYGQQTAVTKAPVMEEKPVRIIKNAGRTERSIAYVLDLTLVVSTVALMLKGMARMMEMDLMDAWMTYPHEVTPLAVTLFCGYYLIYFSVFESTASSTLGKNLLSLKVTTQAGKNVSFTTLFMRSLISLVGFVSLGLFSWYDLQNKMTSTRIIKGE